MIITSMAKKRKRTHRSDVHGDVDVDVDAGSVSVYMICMLNAH